MDIKTFSPVITEDALRIINNDLPWENYTARPFSLPERAA
jgi:hypothetical protein